MKKKIIVFLLVAVLMTMSICLCACNDKEESQRYYDTELKVRVAKVDTSATEGKLIMEKSFFDPIDYIFDVNTSEMHIRIPYDGVDRKIAFYQERIIGTIDYSYSHYHGNNWEKRVDYWHSAQYTDQSGNKKVLEPTVEESADIAIQTNRNDVCSNWFSIVEKGVYEFHWKNYPLSRGDGFCKEREITFFLTIE